MSLAAITGSLSENSITTTAVIVTLLLCIFIVADDQAVFSSDKFSFERHLFRHPMTR